MAQQVPGLVAELAMETGLSVEAAHKLYELALTRAAEVANEVRERWMGLPPGEFGPFTPMTHLTEVMPVDWTALEARGR